MKFPYRRMALLGLRLCYLAGLIFIFYAGLRIFYSEVEYWFWGYIVILVSYGIFLLTFITVYGALKVGEQRLPSLIISGFLAVLFANLLAYLELSLITYTLLPIWELGVITLVQLGFCILGCVVMNRAFYAIYPAWNVVAVIGDDADDKVTLLKMRSIHKMYHIARMVDAAEPLEAIVKAVEPYESVLIGTFDERKKRAVLNACYRSGKRINLIPSPMDIIMNNAAKTQILDTPVLLCRNRELPPEQAIFKRLLDILVSGVGLVVASPVMLVIAAAVKLTDGGPVIFKQKRLTKGRKPFRMYKFRSMRVDAERGLAPGHLLVGEHDPRITKVGRLIRSFRLDELPQLLNILKGDMSLVGPRPERPAVYRQMAQPLPEFDLRLKVKAGLTGYAQIYGRYNTSLRDKLNLDLFYIESYSVLQDLNLLLMTLRVIFIKESAQGVSDDEYGDLDDLFGQDDEGELS